MKALRSHGGIDPAGWQIISIMDLGPIGRKTLLRHPVKRELRMVCS
jgi:hypothetical protein